MAYEPTDVAFLKGGEPKRCSDELLDLHVVHAFLGNITWRDLPKRPQNAPLLAMGRRQP